MRKTGIGVLILISWCAAAGFAQVTSPFADDIEIDEVLRGTGVSPSEAAPVPGNPAMESAVAQPASPSSTAASGKTYRVRSGDYLAKIARDLLGDARRFWDIIELNAARYPSLRKNPNLILVGWELIIPGTVGAENVSKQPEPVVAKAPAAESAREIPTERPATVTSAPPAAVTPTRTPATPVSGEPLLKPGTKVLHIGDSHTVGMYGGEMDRMMRDTGAVVETFGVAGSSPSWWWKGTTTKCGYYSRDDKGKVDRPADWRTPRQTPNIEKLIKDFRPEVLVVSQGANMVGAGEKSIEADTRRLLEIAKANGTKIVWVGPPNGRDDPKRVQQKEKVCSVISRVVKEYGGTFIDSRQFTKYPASGGDGLHYWGSEGKKVTDTWAKSVMGTIQGKR